MAMTPLQIPVNTGSKKNPSDSFDDLDDFKGLVDDGEESASDDESVEIVDDVPDEDRGKQAAPIDSNYQEDDKSIEEELNQLRGAEGLKRRIPQIIKQREDERRAKEAEARARAQATEYAKNMYLRNQELEKLIENQGKAGAAFMQEAAKSKLDAARTALRDANESGDVEAITKAQESFQRALMDEAAAKTAGPPRIAPAPQPPELRQVEPKTQEWMGRNSWFLHHENATRAAVSFHEEAVKRGLTPNDDSYYSFIDEKMKPLLNAFGLATESSTVRDAPAKKVQTQDNVTPVSRSSSSAPNRRESQMQGKKFTLTREQAQLATELMPDIPAAEAHKRYARELAKQIAAKG